MKKYSLLFLLFLFFIHKTFGQKYDNHWVFGQDTDILNPIFGGTDIIFNGDSILKVEITRNVDFLYTNGSICDKEGNFMFATNGIRIIGSDQQVIENGEGLNPGQVHDWWVNYGYTCAQGVIILPSSQQDSLFYIFHTRATASPMAICDEILRTTVDMRKNGGKGKVIEKNNPVLIYDFAYGKISAVKHANGRDWWICMPDKSTNGYHKLLIVRDSIVDIQAQSIGPVYDVDDTRGQALFSPDGTKYARYDLVNDLNIFDFDRCSGELSNPLHITITDASDTSITAGGLAFSPNSRFLYVSSWDRVYQFDTWASDIVASKIVVATCDGFELHGGQSTDFYMAQLGPDGRIYISSLNQVNMLHVIDKPDLPGLACDVRQHGLITPTYLLGGMPHYPNYRLGHLPGSPCDTLYHEPVDTIDCEQKGLVYPNPAAGYFDLIYCFEQGNVAELELFDVLGRHIAKIELDTLEKLHRIDIGAYPNGEYFFVVSINRKRGMAGKVLKLE